MNRKILFAKTELSRISWTFVWNSVKLNESLCHHSLAIRLSHFQISMHITTPLAILRYTLKTFKLNFQLYLGLFSIFFYLIINFNVRLSVSVHNVHVHVLLFLFLNV